jgi:putative oxidoreductase
MHSVIPLFGRVLLSAMFLLSGAGKPIGFEGTAALLAGVGLPVAPLLAFGAMALDMIGGIMLLLGWKTRWAAAALLIFTAAATLLFHDFWSAPPDQIQNQMIEFMKNVTIMGGFLYVIAFGAGEQSLDAKRARRSNAHAMSTDRFAT